ncbi:hypothetical protein [Borreliella mayonii]|uniref:hypothetical protein n=1 Tax=Borreliella mayonii TaxID=1674146 RepID=UPI0030844C07
MRYYSRSFIHRIFNSNLHKYLNSIRNIDIDLLEQYLDDLENKIKIITNKFSFKRDIFKLYYTVNYPLVKVTQKLWTTINRLWAIITLFLNYKTQLKIRYCKCIMSPHEPNKEQLKLKNI